MTRTQKNLIGLLSSILIISILLFRPELLIIKNRPGVSQLLSYLGNTWGFSAGIILFGYFSGKLFKRKWWVGIIAVLSIELFYFIIIHVGPYFLPISFKSTNIIGHFRGVATGKRTMIQFEKNCSQYSTTKFYTMKPGRSRFGSYEFNNEYNVNSKGLRDDEESLMFPQVLFMGDSYSLGWGVDQDKTFPEVFAKKTGLKVLNAGISSYGTAREYLSFKETQKDSLKLVVVQFHVTDLEENNYFVKNKKLDIRPKAEFDSHVKANEDFKPYYLFKNLKAAILDLIYSSHIKPDVSKELSGPYLNYPNFKSDFFEIIKMMRNDYQGPIIFTYIGNYITNPNVVAAFKKYAEEHSIDNIYFVNLSTKLNTNQHYYFFDDHLNNLGHESVAQELFFKWKLIKNSN